jgi:hypothetical protein
MALVRIKQVEPLTGHRLRLTLTNGAVVERDVARYLVGPVFEAIRTNPAVFAQVRVDHGTVVWPGEADLCPDVLIHDGQPPFASANSEKGADAGRETTVSEAAQSSETPGPDDAGPHPTNPT